MTCESSIKNELLDLLTEVGSKILSNRPALNYLIRAVREYTTKDDWRTGNRALVYRDVRDIAFEFGVSVRTINNWERSICSAFGLQVVASCNRRRFANRCPKTGRIVSGYGLELTGLREMLPIMQAIKDEFALLVARRRELRQRLNRVRGRVRQLATVLYCLCRKTENYALEAQGRELDLSVRGRVSEHATVMDLEQMILAAEDVCDELERLLILCKSCGSDVDVSDTSETTFRPIQLPTQPQSYPSDSCSPFVDNTAHKPVRGWRRNAPPSGLAQGVDAAHPAAQYSGLSCVDPAQIGAMDVQPATALRAASSRFLAHLPPSTSILTRSTVVEAAQGLASELGVGGETWNFACQVMGAYPAALCMLVTDNARDRGIKSPGGYFRSLAQRAVTGDLSLDRSIFGAWRSRQRSEAAHA